MYDFEIVVPADLSNPEIKIRLDDFKKFGLHNSESLKVHISFLATPQSDQSSRFLSLYWPENIDVDVIELKNKNVVQKIYHYYEKIIKKNFAKWYIRIDEDSMTDLQGLYDNLNRSFDHDREYHIGARWLYDVCDTDRIILKKLGYDWWYKRFTNYDLSYAPAHEQEIGITSVAAINKVLDNPDCQKYFKLRSEFSEGYGDHGLAFACRMCKIYNSEAFFLSYLPEINYFSIFSGHYNHIHWVGRDRNKKYMEWMEIFKKKICHDLLGKIFLFGNEEEKFMIEFQENNTIKNFDQNNDDKSGLWCENNDKIYILYNKCEELIVFNKDNYSCGDFSMIEK